MASVELKNIRKSFGKFEIVKGIDFIINDGEFVVLVGPSGCGKSTILRIIAGLEKVSDGEIIIDGKKVNNLAPKDRDIAMVFQSYALYPHMTVKENLSFGLKVRKTPQNEMENLVKSAAQMLGIENLLSRYPKELSGGQRQRVAMGRAIVRRPKVFLFDEPLSNLDAALRSQMRVELSKLHQNLKSTMIYVTHDQIEAMTLANKIVVLNSGIIQQIGSPRDLYYNPVNIFVAGFIGSPAMNFISAELVMIDGKLKIKNEFFELSFRQELLKHNSEKDVIVGIRPHDFNVLDTEDDKLDNIINISTEVIEPLGWETLIHGKTGNNNIIIQCSSEIGKKIKINENIRVRVPQDVIYLFDRNDKNSLLKKI